MKRVPYASIILENAEGEVLLLLRDNRSALTCPKHWTLIGGKVDAGETPETAARRELEAETGLKVDLSLWKRYDRATPLFTVDQYIFTGQVKDAHNLLVLGPEAHFFKPGEVTRLDIGYGFSALLDEYFLIRER
jgi:8-oxo-dGTP pyrophosphatase MutT (NUDIX family)